MTDNKRKITLIAVLVIVALAAFLFVYHLPRTIRWTGTADSYVNGETAASSIELDLRVWSKLFREPESTGAVTVDGMRYEDIHQYHFTDGPFIPIALKENFAGRQLSVYDDYITMRRTGNVLTLYLRKGGLPGNMDRIFDIPLK